MSLPAFFVIGAAKAGTTSLYALLDRHPDIFMPAVKEPEFFARDDHYSTGIEAYAARFSAAAPGQIVGEASTIYSLWPLFDKTAERIAAHVPQAKLIYVMRQPVARAYSFYGQLIKNYQNVTRDAQVHRSFEEFVIPERHASAAPRAQVLSQANAHLPDTPELCLAGSEYVQQIEAYLAHFDRSQMLFLTFEDFVRDRPGTLRLITNFLGLEPLSEAAFADEDTTRNVAQTHFDAMGEKQAVAQIRARAGGAWNARRIVPPALRRRLRGWILGNRSGEARAHVPPPMEPQTRQMLEARFAAQLPRLRELTGLDFDDWGLG